MEDTWAPVLSPEWQREFGAVEHALADVVRLEGCECENCQRLVRRRMVDAAVFWIAHNADRQAAWLGAYELDARGAVLRDALAEVGPDGLAELGAALGKGKP